jgi:hypothetical protein
VPDVAEVPNDVADIVEPDKVIVLVPDNMPEKVAVPLAPKVVTVVAPAVSVVKPPVEGVTLPIAVACIPPSASNIPEMNTLAPVYKFPLMPAPPDTTNAPVVGLVDTLPPLRFNAPSTIALPQILEFAFNCAISYTYLF